MDENFRALIESLASTDHQLKKMAWVFGWAADNPAQTGGLVKILRQLDRKGREMFGRALTYRHPQRKTKNPVTCATRILKERTVSLRIEHFCSYYKKHRRKKVTLANGVPCTIATLTRHRWFAVFNCDGARIRCIVYPSQLITLEDNVVKNASALKRLQPLRMDYNEGKKWHPLPSHLHRAALAAIAEKTPLEIAALLAF